MNQQIPPKKKKVFISKSFKYMLAAFSMVSTLGLWGIFSKQDVQAVSATTQPDLQPMPTVMALNDAAISATSTTASSTDALALLPVATQPPSKTTVNNNTNVPSVQILPPSPVTQTRSSRK